MSKQLELSDLVKVFLLKRYLQSTLANMELVLGYVYSSECIKKKHLRKKFTKMTKYIVK